MTLNPVKQALEALPTLKKRLFGVIMVGVIASTGIVAWGTVKLFEKELSPVVQKKVEMIAEQLGRDLSLAREFNIRLKDIPDIGSYINQISGRYPEIRAIVVAIDGVGILEEVKVNQSEYDFVKNLSAKGEDLKIYVKTDRDFTQSKMESIVFDILILLFVGIILSIEITLTLVAFSITNPLKHFQTILEKYKQRNFSLVLRHGGQDAIAYCCKQINLLIDSLPQDISTSKNNLKVLSTLKLDRTKNFRQRAVTDVRIPLFIFVFADELQKSFMPVFVKETGTSIDFLPMDVLLGLPIMVFMGMIALFTPLAGRWADRFGSKRVYLFALAPAFMGHILCAFANDVIWIAAGRAVTGFGYAMIVICCQGYIAGIVDPRARTQGMAAFVGILMSASMAGTAIGGILVERIGYQSVFLLSGCLVLIAGVIANSFFVSQDVEEKADGLKSQTKFMGILLNTKFLVTILMSAIPAKIILTGFIYFIIPLYLFSLGSSSAETGRVMMIYPVLVIALGPITAWVADHVGGTLKILVFGCFLSGVGLVIFHENQTLYAVVLMIILMGVAHAFMKAPQIAFIMEIAETEMPHQGRTAILGLLRTLERVGSVIGPLLAGALVASVGFSNAILVIGCLVSGSALVLLGYFLKNNVSNNKAITP